MIHSLLGAEMLTVTTPKSFVNLGHNQYYYGVNCRNALCQNMFYNTINIYAEMCHASEHFKFILKIQLNLLFSFVIFSSWEANVTRFCVSGYFFL